MDLLKITTDECGNLIITDGEGSELERMKAGTGEPGSTDEFTDVDQLMVLIRQAWAVIDTLGD